MGLRRSVVLAWVLAQGCTFNPATGGVTIKCDGDKDCPQGQFCLLEVRRCSTRDTQDTTSPAVRSVSLQPAFSRPGQTVGMALEVSEPLLIVPELAFGEGATAVRFQALPSTVVEPVNFAWSATLPQDSPEGTFPLRVDLVDRAGNRASDVLLGALKVDGTAPSVASFDALPPLTGDRLVLRPSQGAQLRLLASEEVRSEGLVLEGSSSSCPSPIRFTLSANNGNGGLDFTGVPPLGNSQCSAALVLTGLTDLAGNAAGPLPLGITVSIDGEGPAIEGLSVARQAVDGSSVPSGVFSQQPGFSTLLVEFDVAQDVAELEVSLSQGPARLAQCSDLMASCADAASGKRRCRCQHTLAAGGPEREGPQDLEVTARDVGGNQSRAARPLVLDFSAPIPVPGSVLLTFLPNGLNPLLSQELSAIGPNASASLSFATNEPVAAAPQLVRAGLTVTNQAAAGGFSFSYKIEPGPNPGSGSQCLPLLATATDLAGNTGTTAVPFADQSTCLASDFSPPPPPAVFSPGVVRYTRAPWGSAASPTASRYGVEGQAGAAPEATYVFFFDSASPLEKGKVKVQADGRFLAADLPMNDAPFAVVQSVDAAGNVSARLKVRDISYLSAQSGLGPGSSGRLEIVGWPLSSQSGGFVNSLGVTLPPTNTSLVRVEGGSRLISVGAPLPNHPRGSTSFVRVAYDSTRQRLVAQGGRNPDFGESPFTLKSIGSPTFQSDAGVWAMAPGFAYGAQGQLTSPQSFSRGPMVYLPALDALLAVGGTAASQGPCVIIPGGPEFDDSTECTASALEGRVLLRADGSQAALPGPMFGLAPALTYEPRWRRALVVSPAGTWGLAADAGWQLLDPSDGGTFYQREAAALGVLPDAGLLLVSGTRVPRASPSWWLQDTWLGTSTATSVRWREVLDAGQPGDLSLRGEEFNPGAIGLDVERGVSCLVTIERGVSDWTADNRWRRRPGLLLPFSPRPFQGVDFNRELHTGRDLWTFDDTEGLTVSPFQLTSKGERPEVTFSVNRAQAGYRLQQAVLQLVVGGSSVAVQPSGTEVSTPGALLSGAGASSSNLAPAGAPAALTATSTVPFFRLTTPGTNGSAGAVLGLISAEARLDFTLEADAGM